MPKVSLGSSHLILVDKQTSAALIVRDIYRPTVSKRKSVTLLGLKFAPHRLESERKSLCWIREIKNRRGAVAPLVSHIFGITILFHPSWSRSSILDCHSLPRPAPPPVPAGGHRVNRVGRGGFVDVVREGIAHRDAAEHGAVL